MSESFAYFRWHCLRGPNFSDCRGHCDQMWYGRLYWDGQNWLLGKR